jgi:hypothetical protein
MKNEKKKNQWKPYLDIASLLILIYTTYWYTQIPSIPKYMFQEIQPNFWHTFYSCIGIIIILFITTLITKYVCNIEPLFPNFIRMPLVILAILAPLLIQSNLQNLKNLKQQNQNNTLEKYRDNILKEQNIDNTLEQNKNNITQEKNLDNTLEQNKNNIAQEKNLDNTLKQYKNNTMQEKNKNNGN